MLRTTSFLCRENERQRSVDDSRRSILEIQLAMRLRWSKIVLSAAFLGKYANDNIVTMSQNGRQQSINGLSAGILDNLTGMERRYATMFLSATCVWKTATDDITSAS